VNSFRGRVSPRFAERDFGHGGISNGDMARIKVFFVTRLTRVTGNFGLTGRSALP
jgi:hypothetical protein